MVDIPPIEHSRPAPSVKKIKPEERREKRRERSTRQDAPKDDPPKNPDSPHHIDEYA
jgi:hypothetical protein